MEKNRSLSLGVIAGVSLMLLGFVIGTSWSDNTSIKEPISPGNVEDSMGIIRPPLDLLESEWSTIRLFENAAPSVCYITTSNVRMDLWTRDISEIKRGTGSGFVWDRDGHIVTNYHVIQGADRAQVTLSDQSTWSAKLIGSAPEKDLALLKIEAETDRLKPIPLGQSNNLRVGQNVYAIGNPFGLDQTLTTGIVSALGREIESVAGIPIRDAIQTDAAINPGNSGGPLLNSSGRLIGVNTAIYSPSGASAGIGFSIPVEVVKWVIPELMIHGKIMRPVLGVELARTQITKRLVEGDVLPVEGALVIDVTPGSGAQKAGIEPTRRNYYGEIVWGDLIVGFQGQKIASNDDLFLALEKYQPGTEVEIEVIRKDQRYKIMVTLDAQ
ncbi:MAG: S1C family serine protease [Saprospiraceae bacterium]|jgi:S1-C subfamily serine protease